MRNRFYYISIVLLAIFSFSNRIISKNLSLNKADSLFNLKIYTEAKLIYDSLYYKENLYSGLQNLIVFEGDDFPDDVLVSDQGLKRYIVNHRLDYKINQIANNIDVDLILHGQFTILDGSVKVIAFYADTKTFSQTSLMNEKYSLEELSDIPNYINDKIADFIKKDPRFKRNAK